jgi:hypothetical protein
MVPKLGRILSRLGVSVSQPLSEAQLRGVIKQFSVFSDVPFIGPYIKKCRELLGEGPIKTPTDYKFVTHQHRVPKPDGHTWDYLHRRYGVDKTTHNVWIHVLGSVTKLPWSVPAGAIEPLLARDC